MHNSTAEDITEGLQLCLADRYRIELGCQLNAKHPAASTIMYTIKAPIVSAKQLQAESVLREKLCKLHSFHEGISSYCLRGKGVNGGRGWNLVAFHYPVENTDFSDPTSINSKFYFYTMEWYNHSLTEGKHPFVLYRYECIGAFDFRVMRHDKWVTRLFVSMCMLGCDSNKNYHCRFVYLLGLMTLCVDRRNDHLVWDTHTNVVSLWQGNDLIQYFYCMLDQPFDIVAAETQLFAFIDKNSMIYDRTRCVVRDTHHEPAKRMNNTDKPEQVLKREEEWSLIIGTRQSAIVGETRNDSNIAASRRSSSRIQLLEIKTEEEALERKKLEKAQQLAAEKRKREEAKAAEKKRKEKERLDKKKAEERKKALKLKEKEAQKLAKIKNLNNVEPQPKQQPILYNESPQILSKESIAQEIIKQLQVCMFTILYIFV